MECVRQRIYAPFTYFKIMGWGWYYLCTALDDFSRYILSWRLSDTMATDDVERTLDLAQEQAGITERITRFAIVIVS